MLAKVVTGAAAAALLAVGSGGADATTAYRIVAPGQFAPPNALIASSALTYDNELVPPASEIRVVQQGDDTSGMTVSMSVKGLVPGHEYGAHVHQKACGADPEAAGGHYQHVQDPKQANAENEIWLDFTADAKGDGSAKVHKAWGLRPGGAASIVIHDKPGSAGARVACFTVPFVGVS